MYHYRRSDSFDGTCDRTVGCTGVVRRLLVAVGRSVEAAREVEAARAALEQASRPALHLVGAVDDAEGQTDGTL